MKKNSDIMLKSPKKESFLFRSQVFIVKTVKISTEITDWIFSVSIISQIGFCHVKFLTANKTSFDFFF